VLRVPAVDRKPLMAATTEASARYKSPLHEMASTTTTDFWNDSCSIEELTYAIENGAVGATTNPTIVGDVLKKEIGLWRDWIRGAIDRNPTWSEDEVAWCLIEEMAIKGAALLAPVFEREGRLKGRLSIQTDPRLYRNAAAIVAQALRFGELAPNIQVKIPATRAGIAAVEEVTAAGININATVSFTVPQVIAVAEAVERGFRRREEAGGDTSTMRPVATMMIGRLDDWLEVILERDGILVTPGTTSWAGVACFKRAYAIFQERGYRTRLLAAAYRHQLHWTELIGGDIVLTIPYKWQRLFNASDIEVRRRIDDPVPAEIVEELQRLVPDFGRAYEPDGLAPDEFDSYGATVRTLRSFIGSYGELVAMVREFMLPNPDIPPG
jgi:transaldolase